MENQLLKPTDVDRLLCYPFGKAVKLARQGKLPHIVLPDGQIRFDQQEIEQLIERCRKGTSDDR
jgi:predicted site-specific integrase-resolvase